MDLLVILEIIGMLLKIFGSVLLAMTLAVTTGVVIHLLWQFWSQKNHSISYQQHHKV